MEVSSYGGTAIESSGLVRILKDLSAPIDGRHVLLVEDIIDTGLTLKLPVAVPARQEPEVDQGLFTARQARPASGGNPTRLCRLRDPGCLRGRVMVSITARSTATSVSWAFFARGLRVVRGHSMNSSTAGRGRLVVAAGAIVLIVACFLQWWEMGVDRVFPSSRTSGSRTGACS